MQRATEYSISSLVNIVISRKILVASVAVLITAAVFVVSIRLPNLYKADLVLVPAQQNSTSPLSVSGNLAGLASLAGITIPGGTDTNEVVAVLRSRATAAQLVRQEKLLPILFADRWDANAKKWKEEGASKEPVESDAISYFDKNVCDVIVEKSTGLITVAVTWTDPVLATRWASEIVRIVNSSMRAAALRESDRLIEALTVEASAAPNVELRSAIYEALENQIQTRALLRVREDFALRVVDPIVTADENLRVGPPRIALILSGALFGLAMGMVAAFLAATMSRNKK